MGLILRILPVPESGGLGVESQGQILGLALPKDLEEHVGDPEGGVGRKALRSGQPPDGVESPVDIRADVKKKKNLGGHDAFALLVPYTHLNRKVSREGLGCDEFGRGDRERAIPFSPNSVRG
jgi:hypothetical protein